MRAFNYQVDWLLRAPAEGEAEFLGNSHPIHTEDETR